MVNILDSVNKVKTQIMSSNENIAILVLSIILVGLAIYYLVIKKKEGYDNSENNKLILFHVGWCGHCKQFKPKWDTLPKTIDVGNGSVEVIDELCENENEDAPKRHGVNIEGFPTVFLIKGDQKHEYGGPREPQSIIDWVKGLF